MVDHVLECFGDLNSIAGLLRYDKMESVLAVKGGKLGCMTTNRLGKCQIIFRAETIYGAKVYTHNTRDSGGRSSFIQEKKNVVDLSSRKRFHDKERCVRRLW